MLALKDSGSSSVGGGSGGALSMDREGTMVPDDGEGLGLDGVGWWWERGGGGGVAEDRR